MTQRVTDVGKQTTQDNDSWEKAKRGAGPYDGELLAWSFLIGMEIKEMGDRLAIQSSPLLIIWRSTGAKILREQWQRDRGPRRDERCTDRLLDVGRGFLCIMVSANQCVRTLTKAGNWKEFDNICVSLNTYTQKREPLSPLNSEHHLCSRVKWTLD